jgi:adenylate cyclase
MFTALLVLGETDRAKEWARRAVLMDPDNLGMRYNIACDLIVELQDFDFALEMLRPVCERAGHEQIAWLRSDPDIDPIRDDPRFQRLVADAEARLGITSN